MPPAHKSMRILLPNPIRMQPLNEGHRLMPINQRQEQWRSKSRWAHGGHGKIAIVWIVIPAISWREHHADAGNH
jgi:hypothetical protein